MKQVQVKIIKHDSVPDMERAANDFLADISGFDVIFTSMRDGAIFIVYRRGEGRDLARERDLHSYA